jgi:hypothetical protein
MDLFWPTFLSTITFDILKNPLNVLLPLNGIFSSQGCADCNLKISMFLSCLPQGTLLQGLTVPRVTAGTRFGGNTCGGPPPRMTWMESFPASVSFRPLSCAGEKPKDVTGCSALGSCLREESWGLNI